MMAMHQRRLSPPRTTGYSDPAFLRIADLAHVLAGLVFPPNRQPSAEAGMRRAMSVLRVSSPTELLRVFESPGAARDAVLAELTVGESYFFRDAAQLDLLVTDILPAHRTNDSGEPLRVWSAGCASGEEPYTIAIMLREQGWSGSSHILATDIARPRLAAAQRGRYTRWALRGVSDERIARWFTRNGTYYDLTPTIREMVEFQPFNLVVDAYPNADTDDSFDLVLCRNVMIYFDLATVARIAAGLLAALSPDGWLVLGASDPPLAHLVPCEAIMTPAGMVYRRPGARAVVNGVSSTTTLGTPTSLVSTPSTSSVAVDDFRPSQST
jgi:chemotaxis protein methyltransferase CheR